MAKYWEKEKPTMEAATSKNRLAWYAEAQKLQISLPDWVNKDGETCRGKTVTLDVAALAEDSDNARAILAAVLETLTKTNRQG